MSKADIEALLAWMKDQSTYGFPDNCNHSFQFQTHGPIDPRCRKCGRKYSDVRALSDHSQT